MTQRQRCWRLGFAAIAILLSFASTAYACTVLRGHIVVSGNASTNHSSRVGENGGFEMDYCSGAHKHDGGAANPNGTFTVTMYESTSCASGSRNKLDVCPSEPSANCKYDVNIYNGSSGGAFDSNGNVVRDCMNGDFVSAKADEAFTVNSDGFGTATFGMPNYAPNNNAAVCISDDGANQGNQSRIAII